MNDNLDAPAGANELNDLELEAVASGKINVGGGGWRRGWGWGGGWGGWGPGPFFGGFGGFGFRGFWW